MAGALRVCLHGYNLRHGLASQRRGPPYTLVFPTRLLLAWMDAAPLENISALEQELLLSPSAPTHIFPLLNEGF